MKKALILVALAGYAWVATNARPFSTASYLLVALPSAVISVTYVVLGGLSPRHPEVRAYYEERAHGTSLQSVAPWIAVVVAAVILESVGLGLGGRSSDVPTLSTAIDHLLVRHWARWLLCSTWLTVGTASALRLRGVTRVRGAA